MYEVGEGLLVERRNTRVQLFATNSFQTFPKLRKKE
jgi:hypothetical protein